MGTNRTICIHINKYNKCTAEAVRIQLCTKVWSGDRNAIFLAPLQNIWTEKQLIQPWETMNCQSTWQFGTRNGDFLEKIQFI